jgi:Flp pilus assembly protein TadB
MIRTRSTRKSAPWHPLETLTVVGAVTVILWCLVYLAAQVIGGLVFLILAVGVAVMFVAAVRK